MNKVIFKSGPEFYKKEKSGIKNNVVISVTEEQTDLLVKLHDFVLTSDLDIEVVNDVTSDSFVRKVKDVSYYRDLIIITCKEIKRSDDKC